MNLVPLRVAILLKPDRSHRFPDFNKIPKPIRGGVDWSYFVDRFGGWKYDNTCGHDEGDAESPHGCWLGMLLVPVDFAEQAVVLFPDQCSIMDDAETGEFYENRHTAHEPDVHEDVEALQAIVAKRTAGIQEDADDRNALDPDKPHRGRRRNHLKTWAGYKQRRGVVLDTDGIKRLKK